MMGGLITLAMFSPVGGPKLIKDLIKHLKHKIKKIRDSAYYLRKRGLIEFVKEDDNTIVVKITAEGRKYLKKFDIDNLILKRPEHWDKKWRVVIFDIAEKKKRAREALRQKLQELNFVRLQDSVWVTPFPCGDEIRFIREILGISFDVDIILAEDLGHHEIKLKKYFEL
ncbi:MAG: hypothetical protein HYT13_01005 [Candidatus Liptonbacteria bacterium]|nr:hypothetical protein [Candidatus Liptonbacteria bacterium]